MENQRENTKGENEMHTTIQGSELRRESNRQEPEK